MFKKILVAYDGSELSKKSFSTGIEFATKFNAELIVVSVARPPEPLVEPISETLIEHATTLFRDNFSEMKQITSAQQITARFEIIAGNPARAIIDFAKKNLVNLIIMGSVTEKSLLEQWFMGSVSKQVVHYAHCSVLVLR